MFFSKKYQQAVQNVHVLTLLQIPLFPANSRCWSVPWAPEESIKLPAKHCHWEVSGTCIPTYPAQKKLVVFKWNLSLISQLWVAPAITRTRLEHHPWWFACVQNPSPQVGRRKENALHSFENIHPILLSLCEPRFRFWFFPLVIHSHQEKKNHTHLFYIITHLGVLA